MGQLNDLFVKYGTDKGDPPLGWGYTSAYEKFLEHRRNEIKNVLEIGICGHRDIPGNVVGASLFAWREYFPNAHITGLDNDSRWIFNDQDRISTVCCDAYDKVSLVRAMMSNRATYDFIVDDAVHDPIPQINLLNDLWGLLNPGGIYAIEDVCPYKLPHNNLDHMMRHFPAGDYKIEEFRTHKDERLLVLIK